MDEWGHTADHVNEDGGRRAKSSCFIWPRSCTNPHRDSVFRGAALGGLIHIHHPAEYGRDPVGRDVPQAGQRSQDRMPMQDGRPGRRDAAGPPHDLPRQVPLSCRAVKGSFPGCYSYGTVQW